MWGLEHCVRHTTAALYSSLPLIYIPSYLNNIRCNGTFESCPIEVCYRHNNGCQMSRFCTCIEYIFGLTPFGSQPVTFHSQTQGISRANALLRLKYNSPFIEKIMPLWYNAVLRSWQTAGEGLRQPDAAGCFALSAVVVVGPRAQGFISTQTQVWCQACPPRCQLISCCSLPAVTRVSLSLGLLWKDMNV